MTGELGMRQDREEKDLETWGRQQCVKCRKAGTGLQWGGKVLRQRPVTEEMMHRQMGQTVH